ncbi:MULTISPECIES: hypothetical protein [Paenibacillus]|uniref:hypothetical protein n=1 Tax=Paenibacillus TaxID=44249 RepID=UPI0020BE1881|nr:hypothetical protein [Paenibacillus odorifer]
MLKSATFAMLSDSIVAIGAKRAPNKPLSQQWLQWSPKRCSKGDKRVNNVI